ncbi:Retrotransposon Copia-like, N-terminal [Dillenia turbinata]|uniref:Retrotransposon Copia-like, N-terminal n=1 Tax=Dillenia turbinata TaxID=194707 RepID=A0AAN8ZBC7_9MAGN
MATLEAVGHPLTVTVVDYLDICPLGMWKHQAYPGENFSVNRNLPLRLEISYKPKRAWLPLADRILKGLGHCHLNSAEVVLSDNLSLQISPVKLDGTNYLSLSRSCLLFIQARGLKGYVTGEKPKPAITDSTCNQWEAENSLVGNDAQIYELRNRVHGTKQGEMTIAQYFAELSGLWQELDYYQDFQAVCPEDATKFQKLVEKERIYDFLAGLNMEYDQIRVQVLEKAGLVSKTTCEQMKTGDSSISNKDQLKCDYCGKPGHTKDRS